LVESNNLTNKIRIKNKINSYKLKYKGERKEREREISFSELCHLAESDTSPNK
jgi:hypothetical protein